MLAPAALPSAAPHRPRPDDAARPRPEALPPIAQLLVDGGDARIALVGEGVQSTNRYGLPPLPDPGLFSFGSSTAEVVSPRGLAAAEALLGRLALGSEPLPLASEREWERVRAELTELLGVRPGVEVVFAASGTDLHLIAGRLATGCGPRRGLILHPEAAETGSGVPAALAGLHFSDRTPLGGAARLGAPVSGHGDAPGSRDAETIVVPLRDPRGAVRPGDEVDGELVERASLAARAGRRVLVVLTDVSKTGLLSPVAAVAALRERFPDRLEVLVDACQMRLSPATLSAYLELGFAVAITGSKFVGGPSFCGALLLPPHSRLAGRTLGYGLASYSARGEWPRRFAARGGLPVGARPNLGLMLRWEAALAELRAFLALAPEAVEAFLVGFAATVADEVARQPALWPLAAPPPVRALPGAAPGWDRHPTIFPFALGRATGGAALCAEETARVHRQLRAGEGGAERFHLGQPVPCNAPDGSPRSALRLCSSARLCVEADAAGDGGEAIFERARSALRAAARLAAAQG